MQSVDVWHLLAGFGFAVVLAELDSLMSLTHVVVEGTNIQLVASMLVAHDSLVFVRMVESLDSRVALVTFYSFRT